MVKPSWVLGACLLALSCNEATEGESPVEEERSDRASLSPAELLVRASLDLRGIRPTPEELAAVEDDPDSVDAMVEAFVDDPAFGLRMKDMFAGAWRTRIDFYPLEEDTYDEAQAATHGAIGEEPLDLIAYIAINDLPFTHLLHSTETLVDPVLLEQWPLEAVAEDGTLLPPGVVRARYTDGRPSAGVLAMNSVYWRHSSTIENANRGRANALSQALLCQSYLDRPIDFPSDLDLTDSESIRDAIANNPACQGCHSTLDPFASYLWGFMYGEAEQPQPTYSPELERAWRIYTDTAPAFFGKPGDRLADLADHVAGDERFVACTVRRVYEGMLGRKAVLEDEGALAEHREAFLAGGLTLDSLARSILADPSYRGQRWTPRFGGDPEPVHEKVAPVGVLASSLQSLSGYTLTYNGRPATRLDFGLRALAGGSDRGDTTDVSTGAVLVQRRLAEAGAIFAIDNPDVGGRLGSYIAGVDLSQPPTPDQIVELVRVVRSRTLETDHPEIEAMTRVWADVLAIETPREAWVALVTAVLADPDHLLY